MWVHEILRVFGDRLSADKDEEWLLRLLQTTTKKYFNFELDVTNSIMFGDFVGNVYHEVSHTTTDILI